MPTLDVTLAYVSACGGDLDEWRTRWHEVREELGLPVADDPVTAGDANVETRPWRSRRRLALIFVGAGLFVAVAVATWAYVAFQPSATATTGSHTTDAQESSARARFLTAGPLSAQPVVDGADPKRSGCGSDPKVTTIDSVEVNASDEHFLGVAELRYSPACHVVWGRFTPATDSIRLAGSVVAITAERMRDAPTTTLYQTAYDGQAVFGNILLLDHGCVRITVAITMLSGKASATTNCLSKG